jgi:hypothetical protein
MTVFCSNDRFDTRVETFRKYLHGPN